jgi:hypothetical protein
MGGAGVGRNASTVFAGCRATGILVPEGSRYSLHPNRSIDNRGPTQRKYLRVGIAEQ